jgi:hypothetical protein
VALLCLVMCPCSVMMMLFCLANCYVLKFLEKNVGMKKYFITGLVGSATVQKSVTEQGLLNKKNC